MSLSIIIPPNPNLTDLETIIKNKDDLAFEQYALAHNINNKKLREIIDYGTSYMLAIVLDRLSNNIGDDRMLNYMYALNTLSFEPFNEQIDLNNIIYDTMSYAASTGNLAILAQIYTIGFSLNARDIHGNDAMRRHNIMLQRLYYIEKYKCVNTMKQALLSGNIECVRFVYDHDFTYDPDILPEVLKNSSPEFIVDLINYDIITKNMCMEIALRLDLQNVITACGRV